MTAHAEAVVVGQIARDLVLVVDQVPDAGRSATVQCRREMLGGKGANQAVGLAQLGVRVALLGVIGEDDTAKSLLAQASSDGIDISRVIRREDTGLIVDVVDGRGRWRYLEHLPEPTLLSEEDVTAAGDLLSAARYVIVQLQQPPAAALAAVRCAWQAGRRVVVDGVPDRPDLSQARVLDVGAARFE